MGKSMPLPVPSLRPLHPEGVWLYKCLGSQKASQPYPEQEGLAHRTAKHQVAKMPWGLKMLLLVPYLQAIRLQGGWKLGLGTGCSRSTCEMS